jgi:hypothetical protein
MFYRSHTCKKRREHERTKQKKIGSLDTLNVSNMTQNPAPTKRVAFPRSTSVGKKKGYWETEG